MGVPARPEHTRWRCARCGNLTRFDVVRTVRTAEFWHVDLAGNAQVEQAEVLAEQFDTVQCRWCQRPDSVQDEPIATAPAAAAAAPSSPATSEPPAEGTWR